MGVLVLVECGERVKSNESGEGGVVWVWVCCCLGVLVVCSVLVVLVVSIVLLFSWLYGHSMGL